MPRPAVLLLVLCLGALASFAAACGSSGDEEQLISPTRAEDIKTELDTIEERIGDGECEDLDPAFVRLNRLVSGMPSGTDRNLRRRLQDGVNNLEEVAAQDCEQNEVETATTETTPETIPTVPETTPETVPTTPETTPPPETQPPPQTQPETPDVPDDDGGGAPDIPENPGGEEAPFGQRGGGNGNGKGNGKGKGKG